MASKISHFSPLSLRKGANPPPPPNLPSQTRRRPSPCFLRDGEIHGRSLPFFFLERKSSFPFLFSNHLQVKDIRPPAFFIRRSEMKFIFSFFSFLLEEDRFPPDLGELEIVKLFYLFGVLFSKKSNPLFLQDIEDWVPSSLQTTDLSGIRYVSDGMTSPPPFFKGVDFPPITAPVI